jgi:hypothetical protein
MAKEDKFDVTLQIGVRVTKQGKEGDWYTFLGKDGNAVENKYYGMDYLQVTATLDAIGKFAENLTDFGYAAAQALGFDAQEVGAAMSVAKGKLQR